MTDAVKRAATAMRSPEAKLSASAPANTAIVMEAAKNMVYRGRSFGLSWLNRDGVGLDFPPFMAAMKAADRLMPKAGPHAPLGQPGCTEDGAPQYRSCKLMVAFAIWNVKKVLDGTAGIGTKGKVKQVPGAEADTFRAFATSVISKVKWDKVTQSLSFMDFPQGIDNGSGNSIVSSDLTLPSGSALPPMSNFPAWTSAWEEVDEAGDENAVAAADDDDEEY